jgi:phosphoglycerate-specific signal transduction histidine kinase
MMMMMMMMMMRIMGYNIETINKNTETLIDASKEVGLEVKLSICWCLVTTMQTKTGKQKEQTDHL